MAFWGLAALSLCWDDGKWDLKLVKTSAICIGCAVLFYVIQRIDHAFLADQLSLDWNRYRISAMDYGGLQALTNENIQALGWSQNQLEMIRNSCYLDASASLEKFSMIPKNQTSRTLSDIYSQLQYLWRHSDIVHCMLWAFALTTVSNVVMSLAVGIKKGIKSLLLTALCAAGTSALIIYLGFYGRMPARAVLFVLLPAEGLQLSAFFREISLQKWSSRPKIVKLLAVLCTGCVVVSLAFSVKAGVQYTYNPDFPNGVTVHTHVEAYAMEHPEQLIIGDGKLVHSRELWPDWTGGKPENLLLSWGNWSRTVGYRKVLSSFGYEGETWRYGCFWMKHPGWQYVQATSHRNC